MLYLSGQHFSPGRRHSRDGGDRQHRPGHLGRRRVHAARLQTQEDIGRRGLLQLSHNNEWIADREEREEARIEGGSSL